MKKRTPPNEKKNPTKLHLSLFHSNSNIDLPKDRMYLLNDKYIPKMHRCTISRPTLLFFFFLICTKSAFFRQQSEMNWASYLSQVILREAYMVPWEEEMFSGYEILLNPGWYLGSQSLEVLLTPETQDWAVCAGSAWNSLAGPSRGHYKPHLF